MSQAQDDFEYLITDAGLEHRGYDKEINSIRQALAEHAQQNQTGDEQ